MPVGVSAAGGMDGSTCPPAGPRSIRGRRTDGSTQSIDRPTESSVGLACGSIAGQPSFDLDPHSLPTPLRQDPASPAHQARRLRMDAAASTPLHDTHATSHRTHVPTTPLDPSQRGRYGTLTAGELGGHRGHEGGRDAEGGEEARSGLHSFCPVGVVVCRVGRGRLSVWIHASAGCLRPGSRACALPLKKSERQAAAASKQSTARLSRRPPADPNVNVSKPGSDQGGFRPRPARLGRRGARRGGARRLTGLGKDGGRLGHGGGKGERFHRNMHAPEAGRERRMMGSAAAG